jgi:hypothetical protein
MKTNIVSKQATFISNLINDTNNYINSLDKTNIQTILLSGSISRGDYYPGKFGGMIDLTVMKIPGSTITAESIFGPNEEPDIPFHCITISNTHYQILFLDFVDFKVFQNFDEPRKFALLESQILYDKDNKYKNELETIIKFSQIEQYKLLNNCIGYISYLLSDYKKDRWHRREAYCQMHENLNTSIRLIIQSIYYLNNKYAPAEDRRLYYSYTLNKKPNNYEEIVNEVYKQLITSEDDYYRRESIFNKVLLEYVLKNRPTTAST